MNLEVLSEEEVAQTYEDLSFYNALAIVESTDEWYEYIGKEVLPVSHIVSLITFENSNEVAYGLYHSDPVAAKALYEELKYNIKGPTND